MRLGARRQEDATLSRTSPVLRFLFAVFVTSCTRPPPPEAPKPPPLFLTDTHPKSFHSARFELRVPLPDGHAWRIDDHTSPFLVATHAATGSKVTLGTFALPELANRQKCEAASKERGLVPKQTALSTLEEAVTVGPGAYDTHLVVALEPGTSPQAVVGHVFMFGGFIRKCFFAHYATVIAPGEDETTLSTKLAIARLQILGGVTLEAFDKPKREVESPRDPSQ
jgi:hypothetical protein